MGSGSLEVAGPPLGLLSLGELLEDPSPTDSVLAAEVARDACRRVAFAFWTDRWDSETAGLAARADEYLPRAARWLTGQSGHPWEASLDDQRQIWVSAEGVHPEPADFEPPAGYFGFGAFGPSCGGLWTSTEVLGLPSPFLEDVPNWPRHVWALRPASHARVFEIRTSEDWRSLVATYPQIVEREAFTSSSSPVTIPAPFYLPAWDAVAADWDGVRFTMAGKLRTIFVLVPVADGYTLVIDERGVEQTLRLRWIFESIDDEGCVSGKPARNRQLFTYQGPPTGWPGQLDALHQAGWEEIPIESDPAYGNANFRDPTRHLLLQQRR